MYKVNIEYARSEQNHDVSFFQYDHSTRQYITETYRNTKKLLENGIAEHKDHMYITMNWRSREDYLEYKNDPNLAEANKRRDEYNTLYVIERINTKSVKDGKNKGTELEGFQVPDTP
jgi:hypothetical protein